MLYFRFKSLPVALRLFLLMVLTTASPLQAAGQKPSVPSNLTGTIENGMASLTWDVPADDDGVEGYNIYVNDRYTNTVRTNHFSLPVTQDTLYTFKVAAFDKVPRKFSVASEPLKLPTELVPQDLTVPPSVPTDLSGTVSSGAGNDTVTLTWSASTDDQAVAGYNVYRNRTYIATRFGTQYVGTVPSGSSNDFTIVAFDFDGNFSAQSRKLTLAGQQQEINPRTPPSVPTGLTGKAIRSDGQTQWRLSWNPSSSSVKVAGYNIYRDDAYRTTVFTTTYSEWVATGEAHAYQVVAFDSFGNFSAKSTPLNLFSDANQVPYFNELINQDLVAGEPWELVLRPIDPDGGAAGILVSNTPPGMSFIDNRDGSRSLKWQPGINDIGSYQIIVTAFDLRDTSLRSLRNLTITVHGWDTPVPVAGGFSLAAAAAPYQLQEGDSTGVSIPVTLSRTEGYDGAVQLSLYADNPEHLVGLKSSFSIETLTGSATRSELRLKLDISALPILPGQRQLTIRGNHGTRTTTTVVTVAVIPVARDDVYLLIGQSNAVGFSEEGAKQSGSGEADEKNLRIRQANVQSNDPALYTSAERFTDIDFNFPTPDFVTAEDPLHEPVDPATLAKEGTRIGMGLSFAKAALAETTRRIILVPAAWGGTGFCKGGAAGANWNARPVNNPELGNTLLFDRALARVNYTLKQSGGILRGILWHQGETDAVDECAPFYEENLTRLVAEFRTRIVVDARGRSARGAQANVPFVLGTLSRGVDERGDFSNFSASKQIVDSVHRNIAGLVPHSDVVLNDGFVPANGYPCGWGSCIHFGSSALREMGALAYEALQRAAAR